GPARPDHPAYPRRRRRDRRALEDRVGVLCARDLGDRDGRELSQGQEARAALRRLPQGRIRRQGDLCRRAGGDRRRGAERVVEISLNSAEQKAFDKSVAAVEGLIEACKKIAPKLA